MSIPGPPIHRFGGDPRGNIALEARSFNRKINDARAGADNVVGKY
jgi:hypothetical protein